ncbi:C40 family peptidase [Alkalihalobacillus sp. AL-G]|uniref:C40 family peptidase n=1 Tax=Alkalihalobacillus sp. AL-G TaxID=2926399 RepID=UPI00272CB1EB|nr:LysM peptidoglycan-binding domain-containing protein [Alkalihalobacillus sp. AL-G]WLD93025.1 LysM peptidoglycan-binding domain-containing protein [Alkalihalobacillus sp. AL-G]
MRKVLPSAMAAGVVLAVGSEAYASAGNQVVQSAEQFLGTPYRYGSAIGNTGSFDCSSFTATVFKQYGIDLPRSSRAQAGVGTRVSSGDLLPGDLVFFDTDFDGRINHVAIYAGGGRMIGAQSSGVGYADVFSPYYWADRYVTARRVLSDQVKVEKKPPLVVLKGEGNAQKEEVEEKEVAVRSLKFHTVVRGDTLWDISRTYGTSVKSLKQLNDLSSHWIYPGQTLLLSEKEVADRDPVVHSYSVYTIQKGNTLWGISKKYGITVKQLMETNNLNSSLIFPDQQLMIPR